MKTIQVFDPALCCSTGVCGVDIDQALVNFSADVDWAKQNGARIERFNLAQQPMAFAQNATVKAFLERSGEEALPVVLVNGEIALAGRYPNRAELARWAGVAEVATEANRAMLRWQQMLLKSGHEVSRTAAALPLLHRQGWRRQDFDCLRDGDSACRRRTTRAARQHRSGVQCRPSVRRQYWQQDHRHSGRSGLFALEIDPQAAAQAYRDRIVGPVRGVLPEAVVKGIEEQLSGACTTEIAAFDEFTALLTDIGMTADYDHVIFDTAPTGHTIRLLQLPGAWSGFLGGRKGRRLVPRPPGRS